RRLLHERDDRFFDQWREGRGADGGQRREQQSVGQTSSEARLLAVFLVVVDRMVVAGHAGEKEKVRVGQRPRRALEPIADREVFEVPLLHQSVQKISFTTRAS